MEDINYRTEPLEEAFSHEVTLAYPTFLKSARRSNSKIVEAEDIVQEALGEAWKYASANGMPKTRTEFVKFGVHIVGWKISDSYKKSRKLEKEISNSDNIEVLMNSAERLTKKRSELVVDEVIYNEMYRSFSDKVALMYYSTNPVGAMIPYFIDGANMSETASRLGYPQSIVAKTKATLDRIFSEITNP